MNNNEICISRRMAEDGKSILVDMIPMSKDPTDECEKYIHKKEAPKIDVITKSGKLILTSDRLNELQNILMDNRRLFGKFAENDFDSSNMLTSKVSTSKFGDNLKHGIGIRLRELSDVNVNKVYSIVYSEYLTYHDLFIWSNIGTKRIYPPNMTRQEAAKFEYVDVEDLSWHDRRLKKLFESNEIPEIHAIGKKLMEDFCNVTPKNPFYFIGPQVLREGDYEYYCHYDEGKNPPCRYDNYQIETNGELHDGTHTIFTSKSTIGFFSSDIICSFKCDQEIYKKMGELKSPTEG